MRWRPTKNPNKFWSLCLTLSPSTSTWNWQAFRWSPTSKSQKDWIFPSGKIVTKKVESSFSVPSSISWRISRLTIRTQSATRLSNFWSHFWFQELNGSTMELAVRCLRLSLLSASGSMPSSNTTKNHRSWSRRRLNLPLKRPISKSPRKNWQKLVRSWESSQKNWTNSKKILRNNLILRTNLSLKPRRPKRKSQLPKPWSTHSQENEHVGKRAPLKFQMKRRD